MFSIDTIRAPAEEQTHWLTLAQIRINANKKFGVCDIDRASERANEYLLCHDIVHGLQMKTELCLCISIVLYVCCNSLFIKSSSVSSVNCVNKSDDHFQHIRTFRSFNVIAVAAQTVNQWMPVKTVCHTLHALTVE